jgi:flavin reductase
LQTEIADPARIRAERLTSRKVGTMLVDTIAAPMLGLVTREEFTQALACFATGVTVVTTDGPAGRYGRTVSSACSLCATPPSVLVCIDRQGAIADALLDNGAFCVSALAEGQRAVSDVFAGRPPLSMEERFSRTAWIAMRSGSPALADAAACLDCRYAAHFDHGTHRIVVGVVQATRVTAATPLVYARRGHGRFTPLAEPRRLEAPAEPS